VVLSQFATKNHTVTLSSPLPSGMGRRIRRKKDKHSWVGMRTVYQTGKGRRKQSIILTKSIYNMQRPDHPMLSLLLRSKSLSLSHLLP